MLTIVLGLAVGGVGFAAYLAVRALRRRRERRDLYIDGRTIARIRRMGL